MDIGSTLRLLLRRWLVVLVGLAITLGAAYFVRSETPYSYQGSARMLLLLPAEARGDDAVGSPFLYLPNGLIVLARVIAAAPTTDAARAELTAAGLDSEFEVGVAPTAPEITISVQGTDPQDVIATRDGVVRIIEDRLRTVQQEVNAPEQQIARAMVYSAEETPQQIAGDRSRALIGVLGAGGLATLLAAFLIDRLLAIKRNSSPRRIADSESSAVDRGTGRAQDTITVNSSEGSRVPRHLSAESSGEESYPWGDPPEAVRVPSRNPDDSS